MLTVQDERDRLPWCPWCEAWLEELPCPCCGWMPEVENGD